MSRYEADSYCYPESDVLRNKLDIRNQAALDAFEADATAIRMVELIESPITGDFDFKHLLALHYHLFQDIYDWAGEIRTVDISRENSRFANVNHIENYLEKILYQIKADHFFKDLSPELFIAKLAHVMAEINATHLFRDGNGRTQRLFCELLAERAGYFVDFSNVEREQMYQVMTASFNTDEAPLANLLEQITSIIE